MVYMTELDEIKAEIKQLEKELKDTKDYNRQWELGHKLKDLYSKQYKLEEMGFQ